MSLVGVKGLRAKVTHDWIWFPFFRSGIHPKPIIIFIGLLLIQQQQQQHIRVANIRKADFSIQELRCHGAAKIRKQVTITSFLELLRLICGQLL